MYTIKPWIDNEGFVKDSALGENLPWSPMDVEEDTIVGPEFLTDIEFENWMTDDDEIDPEITICILEGRHWDALKKMEKFFGGNLSDFIVKN